MVSAKFTQKFLQTRPAAGLAKHPFKRIHLFLLIVLVYIRLVKLVLQHATYIYLPVSLPVSPVTFLYLK